MDCSINSPDLLSSGKCFFCKISTSDDLFGSFSASETVVEEAVELTVVSVGFAVVTVVVVVIGLVAVGVGVSSSQSRNLRFVVLKKIKIL